MDSAAPAVVVVLVGMVMILVMKVSPRGEAADVDGGAGHPKKHVPLKQLGKKKDTMKKKMVTQVTKK
jgi:hypothetical protein